MVNRTLPAFHFWSESIGLCRSQHLIKELWQLTEWRHAPLLATAATGAPPPPPPQHTYKKKTCVSSSLFFFYLVPSNGHHSQRPLYQVQHSLQKGFNWLWTQSRLPDDLMQVSHKLLMAQLNLRWGGGFHKGPSKRENIEPGRCQGSEVRVARLLWSGAQTTKVCCSLKVRGHLKVACCLSTLTSFSLNKSAYDVI